MIRIHQTASLSNLICYQMLLLWYIFTLSVHESTVLKSVATVIYLIFTQIDFA